MPTTASGIVYPASTDDVDVPGDLGALAASVESIVAKLLNPPKARIHNSASQSVANATATQMLMDTTDIDTDTMADLTNNQLVVHTAGTYLLVGQVFWTANATGYRQGLVYAGPGAATLVGEDSRITTGAAAPTAQVVTAVVQLNVGDQIVLRGAQASGGALAAFAPSTLSAVRVGP